MQSGDIKKETPDFEPSMRALSRITKTMLESGSIGRTSLSQKTKINYPRLIKHLVWLTKKHLIESVVKDDKVKLRLTEKGRTFALTLCDSDFTL